MINQNEPFDIIFIAGAPGSGKSTIAKGLYDHLKTPYFEFGWIPEFQDKGNGKPIGYTEEESIAFENLALVVKNYIKHGYKNIIVTDLENERIGQLQKVFDGYSFLIITLYMTNESVLKSRVLDPNRSSSYRDFETAIEINSSIQMRNEFTKEIKVDITDKSPDQTIQKILHIITPAR